MDASHRLNVFCVLLTFHLLVSCAMVGGPQGGETETSPRASHTPTRVAVDVRLDGDELRIAMTGLQPFSYQLSHTDTAPGLVVHILHAHFVDQPERIAVDKAGVTYLDLGRLPGDAAGARLQIHLAQPTAYRTVKEPQRLMIYFQRVPVAHAGLDTTQKPDTRPPLGVSAAEDYRVGPKDVLDITVYREPDLSQHYRVSGTGVISFPLIGPVQVAGLTMAQVERTLERRLAQGYLVNPQVSIIVTAYESQQVLLLGEVRNPGYYPLRGRTTLLDILSRAGGLKPGTHQSKFLVLMRQREAGRSTREEDAPIHTRIDLDRLFARGDMTLNVPLQSNDVIFVPPLASIVVFGEVKNPGTISLSEHMTVVQAISKAGGFTSFAAPSRVRIIRAANGVESTMRVNVDDVLKRGGHSGNIALEPDDIVVVPESLF